MNYLLVSTGGTGSTVLQRLITINLYLNSVEVRNTHDLVNKSLQLDSNKNIVRNGKKQYDQSLSEIELILKEANPRMSIISRLSKNHTDFRQDDSKQFYKFLNFVNDFFHTKVACVRENVFELAMSLAIKQQSNVYNVFNDEQRKKVNEVSRIDEKVFIQKCDEYLKYLMWLNKNFPSIDKVSYEDVITNTDEVLYRITGYKNTLPNYFGVPSSKLLRLGYSPKDTDYKEKKAFQLYKDLCEKLITQDILRETPYKNTSLQDKKNRIKNFDKCLKIFYQYTRNNALVNQNIATYDFWNQKNIDSEYQPSV